MSDDVDEKKVDEFPVSRTWRLAGLCVTKGCMEAWFAVHRFHGSGSSIPLLCGRELKQICDLYYVSEKW